MKNTKILMLLTALLLSVVGYADVVEIDGLGYNLDAEKKEAVLYRMVEGNAATEIVIPETVVYENEAYPVKSIWMLVFANCTNITSVTIPNTVEKIWDCAFSGCTSLVSVNIPESAKSIGQWAFSGCTSLKSIVIPKSVEKIEDAAFKECGSLESIVVSSENPYYDSREGCNAIIETATNKLIAGCKNTIIPNTVTAIGNYAFCGCRDLESVTLPESLECIGYYSFAGTGLTTVTIPVNVNEIGLSAFPNLNTVYSLSPYFQISLSSIFKYRGRFGVVGEWHVLKHGESKFLTEYKSGGEKYRIIGDIDPVTLTVDTDDNSAHGQSGDDTDPAISTGIESVTNSVTTGSDKIFSVSGQRLGKPVKGVNIIKGKKVVF
jgi:hypothetical protein